MTRPIINDTVTRITALARVAVFRATGRKVRKAAERQVLTLDRMGAQRRADIYKAQNGGNKLTPKQLRRIVHKGGHQLRHPAMTQAGRPLIDTLNIPEPPSGH